MTASARGIGFGSDQVVDAEGRRRVSTVEAEVRLAHVDGRPQLFAGAVQLTEEPSGVDMHEVEPDGRHVWWFAADGDGTGRWRRVPTFGGTPQTPLRGLPHGRPYGVAFSESGWAAVALGVDGTTRCYLGVPGGDAQAVRTADGYLGLVDMADDASLLALAGSPAGPSAVFVVSGTGEEVARLAGGSDRRIWPLEFRPGPDPQLLLVVENGSRFTTATWSHDAGLVTHDWIGFEAEITAYWYADAILVRHDLHGRSHLYELRPQTRQCREIPAPKGSLHDLGIGVDGGITSRWSADGVAAVTVVLRPHLRPRRLPAPGGPPGHRRSELWTVQPYGRIHSFVATPPGTGPWPTLFLVHGGPAVHDRDAFDGRTEFFLGAGYAVVRTNYRGSTGYGTAWRRAAYARVGLAQIEDLAAVRRELVARGIADEGRIGLCGHSWGGYLVLLALGVQPDVWNVGLAGAPIADYPRAHEATTPALRELDRELFGGSPDEVPQRYTAASPLTYVTAVRSPLLLTVSRRDEKCPPEQIERYTARLRAPHEVRWLDGGHHSLDLADHAATFAAMDRFARAAFAGARPQSTVPTGTAFIERARRR